MCISPKVISVLVRMFFLALDTKLPQFIKTKEKRGREHINLLFSVSENSSGNVSFRPGWTQRLKEYDQYSIIYQPLAQLHFAMAVF